MEIWKKELKDLFHAEGTSVNTQACTPLEQAHVANVANALEIALPECSSIGVDDDGKVIISSLNLWGTFEIMEIETDGDVFLSRSCGLTDSYCRMESRAWASSIDLQKLNIARSLILSQKNYR